MQTNAISILGPDYDQIVPMASGGTGELFRAHKCGLDVDVVIKRVKAQFRGRMNETREANILKKLRHEYLPRIYDVIYASDGFVYTIMDYIPGCDLSQYVQRYGALSQKQTLKWLRQLCQVTAYLHKQHPAVIHCDLKPQNIMITPDGDICVIDFNTSLLRDKQEQDPLGATLGFAAPEQYNVPAAALNSLPQPARDKWLRWSSAAAAYGKITEQTDIYSMGAVAYFMLTGYAPNHPLDGCIPLTRYRIHLGESLRAVIEKAMQPIPRERFSSANAMLKALENLKKTDKRYKSWQTRCQVSAVILSALVLLSSFSVWAGWTLRKKESHDQYLNLVQQSAQLVDQQRYDEALTLLGQAISLEDDQINAYVQMATILYRTGRYSACTDLLTDLNFVADDAILSQEEFEFAQAELNYLLGSCHYQLGEYTQAVQSFELATWFAPEESAYYRDLAVAQALAGNPGAAQKTLDKLEHMPESQQKDILFVRGELSFASGDYRQALEALLEHIRVSGAQSSARSYLLAAQCYRNLGTDYLADEISLLEQGCSALDLSSANLLKEQLTDACLRHGVQSGAASHYQKALDYAEELMDQEIASLSVRLNAALALQYLNRHQEALTLQLETVDQYSNDYRSYVRLALLYLTEPLKNPAAARNAYEQAKALYSSSGEQSSEFTYLQSQIDRLTS